MVEYLIELKGLIIPTLKRDFARYLFPFMAMGIWASLENAFLKKLA
jgi:hypothetical protein